MCTEKNENEKMKSRNVHWYNNKNAWEISVCLKGDELSVVVVVLFHFFLDIIVETSILTQRKDVTWNENENENENETKLKTCMDSAIKSCRKICTVCKMW